MFLVFCSFIPLLVVLRFLFFDFRFFILRLFIFTSFLAMSSIIILLPFTTLTPSIIFVFRLVPLFILLHFFLVAGLFSFFAATRLSSFLCIRLPFFVSV